MTNKLYVFNSKSIRIDIIIKEFTKFINCRLASGIIEMILLFLLLTSNIVKVEKVEPLANFFLDHLAFFFIPASVGLMTSFADLKSSLFKIILLCIITTIIVLSATALTVEFICKKKSKHDNDDNNDFLNKKEA